MATTTIERVVTITMEATATVTVSPTAIPYWELPTAILSTTGIFLVLVGAQIIAIVGFSSLALVPVLSALGNAIGCGLSYYLFYSQYSTAAKMRASAFADLGWLLQEIVLPFYSFLIVRKLLRGKERHIFHAVFYFFILAIFGCRMAIIPLRIENFRLSALDDVVTVESIQKKLNALHVAYFTCIAASELWACYFLLKVFRAAHTKREAISSGKDRNVLYKKLSLSTEIRLVFVAVIGVARAVSFSFQTEAQSANSISGQADRFISVFECLLPVVFYVDMLTSKLVFQQRYVNQKISNPSSGYTGNSGGIRVKSEFVIDYSSNQRNQRHNVNAQTIASVIDGTINDRDDRDEKDMKDMIPEPIIERLGSTDSAATQK